MKINMLVLKEVTCLAQNSCFLTSKLFVMVLVEVPHRAGKGIEIPMCRPNKSILFTNFFFPIVYVKSKRLLNMVNTNRIESVDVIF